VWLVGQMNDQNRTLTTSKTQQEGDGWTCQRALTAAVNIVADVLTCSGLVDDQAAASIVRQIADRVTGQ
jgi:PknH-like extracellular domain